MHSPGGTGQVAARLADAARRGADWDHPERFGSMTARILVDAPEFWSSLRADIQDAKQYAWLQTFSFEGDGVGEQVADALLSARCADRRLLIDAYTRINQNDRLIHLPGSQLNRAYMAEVRNTRRLVSALAADGVQVRYGMPLGLLLHKLLRRDHKKIAVFDDRVAYIGGINFCEHNFEWHDMMIRVEDAELACALREDFEASWAGRAETRALTAGPVDLHLLAGAGSDTAFTPIFDMMAGARRSITVVCPYLTPPFTDHLRLARRRGVEVLILTPANNNRRVLKAFVRREAERWGHDLRIYPDRMIHMKALLIDDEALVAGSSNFDLLSYYGLLNEVMAVSRDPALIAQFRERVLLPGLARAERHSTAVEAPVLDLSEGAVRAAAFVAALLMPRRLSLSGNGRRSASALPA
jgi:cardiolipin synthase A/B